MRQVLRYWRELAVALLYYFQPLWEPSLHWYRNAAGLVSHSRPSLRGHLGQLCLDFAVVEGIIQSSHRGLNDIIHALDARVGRIIG